MLPDEAWHETERQQNWTNDEPDGMFRQKPGVFVESLRQLTLDEANNCVAAAA